jgi:hypothetical protein
MVAHPANLHRRPTPADVTACHAHADGRRRIPYRSHERDDRDPPTVSPRFAREPIDHRASEPRE